MLASFAEGGNFDIKYLGPNDIVMANYDRSRIDRFNLTTMSLTTVVEGPPLQNPIGIAVSPNRTLYYIADQGAGAIFSYSVRGRTLTLLADQGPSGEGLSPDGITVDAKGHVVFSDKTGSIYRVDPATGAVELVATIPDASLNGIIVDPQGNLVVAAEDTSGEGSPGGVYRVEFESGAVTPLWVGLPFRDSEDVALDARGNLYVSDTDYQQAFGDFVPAEYVLRGASGPPETLVSGAPPLGDVVDILLTPFTGLSSR